MTNDPIGRESPDAGHDGLTLARAYLTFLVREGCTRLLVPPPPAAEEHGPLTLDAIRDELGECTRCALHGGRKNLVFGEGPAHARIMFVGEAPGADEDREGRPFIGAAGRLLTRMIEAMGLQRSQVYITNVVKCRPPQNRDPKAGEIGACIQFLRKQIDAVAPEVIIAMGRHASQTLLGTRESLGRLRGEFREYQSIPVMPTYHPAFLLRQREDRRFKAEAWADLKKVMGLLDMPVPRSGGSS